MTPQTSAPPAATTATGTAKAADAAAARRHKQRTPRPKQPDASTRAGGKSRPQAHPWAGVSSARRVEVEAARERLSAGRAGAV
nr:hypothetical protein [Micromonospora sp. DSM 115978]